MQRTFKDGTTYCLQRRLCQFKLLISFFFKILALPGQGFINTMHPGYCKCTEAIKFCTVIEIQQFIISISLSLQPVPTL